MKQTTKCNLKAVGMTLLLFIGAFSFIAAPAVLVSLAEWLNYMWLVKAIPIIFFGGLSLSILSSAFYLAFITFRERCE